MLVVLGKALDVNSYYLEDFAWKRPAHVISKYYNSPPVPPRLPCNNRNRCLGEYRSRLGQNTSAVGHQGGEEAVEVA